MTDRLPGGTMKWATVEKRWKAVRDAARSGDPDAMAAAVSRFEPVVDTFRAIALNPRKED